MVDSPILKAEGSNQTEESTGPEPQSDNTTAIPSLDSSSDVLNKRTAIFIQDECLKHRFIRSRDTSGIFERPERLHAVKLGLAAAIARIEYVESVAHAQKPGVASEAAGGTLHEGDLTAALARMTITPALPNPSFPLRTGSVLIRRTSASASLLDNAAVKYVHGDIEGDVYLKNLIAWACDSQRNITEKGLEIPEEIPPLDLYRQYFLFRVLAFLTRSGFCVYMWCCWRTVCPGSIDAIQGAIGAVCEAVDASVKATRGPRPSSSGPNDPCERVFVAIRPPGHHCGEDTPSGFCFVNNVAVGAAHGMCSLHLVRSSVLTCARSSFKPRHAEDCNP